MLIEFHNSFKYLFNIRWKYFEILMFLFLHFLLVCKSFNHILASFEKKIQTSLQFCHSASFIIKLRCLLSYFYSTHIRCVSNWIQLVDSAPNKHIFLMHFLSGWFKWRGGGMSSEPPSLMFANSLMIIYDSASLSSEISLPIFPVQFSFSSCFLFLRFEISPNRVVEQVGKR